MPFPTVTVAVAEVGFEGVVKFAEEEYALVPLGQTACTWNSYCVVAAKPFTVFELAVDVVFIQAEVETGLYRML